MQDIQKLSIQDIGSMIHKNWQTPYFGAVPYIAAMQEINDDGMYINDPWQSIIAYFLGNAKTWRGDIAKEVKAELNRRLKKDSLHG